MQSINDIKTTAHLINSNTNPAPARRSGNRARWAAFGAAVAVSLGAGGLGIASATSPDGASAYVPISPCRLADTRASSNVGPFNTPLGADQVFTFDGWGDVPGDCNLPTNTTGLQLNVTAVGATQLTNLRFYPNGQQTPTVSNLNPAPGTPPTPNAVAVSLNTTNGKFDVFNRFGNVDIVIDVAGYYTEHMHDGDDIVNSSLTRVDIADEPGIAYASAPNPNPIGALDTIVSVDLHAPASGHVTVSASAVLDFTSGGDDQVSCLITDGSGHPNTALEQIVTEPIAGRNESLQMTRSFPVSAAGEVTYAVVCGTPLGDAVASQAFITATYVPTWRGDVQLAPFPAIDLPIIIDQGI